PYKARSRRLRFPNPNNAVGGSFRHSLQVEIPAGSVSLIPTQLVDRSGTAYKARSRRLRFPNPTNAVGGSFSLNLQSAIPAPRFPNPTNAVGGSFSLNLKSAISAAPVS